MPLSAKVAWRQTNASVWVDISLRGGSRSVIDTLVTRWHIKISHPPYLTTIDLFGEIDDDSVRLVYDGGENVLTVEAKKATPGPWPDLVVTKETMDKEAVEKRRAESIQARMEKEAKMSADQATLVKEQARQSVRAQMEVEEKQRRLLETAKVEQKKAAEAEVFAALSKLAKEEKEKDKDLKGMESRSTMASFPASSSSAAAVFTDEDAAEAVAPPPSSSSSSSRPPAAAAPPESVPSAHIVDDEEVSRKALPAPRARAAGVQLSFTPRAFPTPLRESKQKEEEDWLARNYVKLQQHKQQQKKQQQLGDAGGPTTPFAEKDATWLKSKGDEFFKLGDFGSAINAYTAALATEPASIPILLNRAASFLQKALPAACVQDTTEVLRLLGSAAKLDAKQHQQRARALARRMTALVMEGKFASALEDAEQLAAADESLEEEIEILRGLVAASKLKEQGDAAAQSDPSGALALYGQALAAQPSYAVAYLNRSATLLRMERFEDAAKDCRTILELLGQPAAKKVGTAFEEGGAPGDAAAAAAAGGGAAAAAAPSPASGQGKEGISPIPKTGSPLYQQILQRAQLRLAECEKKMGGAGEGGATTE